MTDEPSLSLRLQGDQLVLKLGDQKKVLKVTPDVTDEVTNLARTLLTRRAEIHAKWHRDTLAHATRVREAEAALRAAERNLQRALEAAE